VHASGGENVPLCATQNGMAEEPYHFTRANTGKPKGSGKLVALARDEASRRALEAAREGLAELIETGSAERLAKDAEARDMLGALARDLNLESTDRLLRSKDRGEDPLSPVGDLVRHVRDGSITKVTGGQALLALSALHELSGALQEVEDALSRRLKGRTIRAHIGTPVTAYVAADVRVLLPRNGRS
jgi:hypothetical protein